MSEKSHGIHRNAFSNLSERHTLLLCEKLETGPRCAGTGTMASLSISNEHRVEGCKNRPLVKQVLPVEVAAWAADSKTAVPKSIQIMGARA